MDSAAARNDGKPSQYKPYDPEKKEGDAHEIKADFDETPYKDIVIPGEKFNIQKVQADFNGGRKDSAIVSGESYYRGIQVHLDQVLIVKYLNQPHLILPPHNGYWVALNAPFASALFSNLTEAVGVYHQTGVFYGALGSYVLNVPPGKLALAYSGNEPKIYGSGTHIIRRDPNFQFENKELNAADLFLHSRTHTGLIDSGAYYIRHGNIQILRVPEGQVAKVRLGTKWELLPGRAEPYVYNNPNFEFYPQINQGKITWFEDASQRLISHQTVKWVTPRTGEVFISYNKGQLDIIKEPRKINEAQHVVEPQFLQISLSQPVFPSEIAIANNKALGIKADRAGFIQCRTSDGLEVGVRLLVAYSIPNAEKAIQQLKDTHHIKKHVELTTTADVMAVISSMPQSEIMSMSGATKKRHAASAASASAAALPSAPARDHYDRTLTNAILRSLKEHLAGFGIEPMLINIEWVEIFNKELEKQFEQQALKATQVRANATVMSEQTEVARQQAEQEASVATIRQTQEASAKVIAAQKELEAAELRAKAAEIEARAAANKIAVIAAAEAEALQRRAAAEAKALEDPNYRALAMLRAQVEPLTRAKLTIIPDTYGALAGFARQGRSIWNQPSIVEPETPTPTLTSAVSSRGS